MIHHITDTKSLRDVCLEDSDDMAGSVSECYMINVWYFYYFATLEAAQEKARKLGISEEVVK